MRVQFDFVAEPHMRPDDAIGADLDIRAKLRGGIDDGGGVNMGCHARAASAGSRARPGQG